MRISTHHIILTEKRLPVAKERVANRKRSRDQDGFGNDRVGARVSQYKLAHSIIARHSIDQIFYFSFLLYVNNESVWKMGSMMACGR